MAFTNDTLVPVIGLEVHAQLLTRSKLFSSDAVRYGEDPNTRTSWISLAHPGTLPVVNRQAIELAIRMGMACNSTIARAVTFDRKNYFYPDLPKGYQLTQDANPVAKGGSIRIAASDGSSKMIALNRIHLEEDAGKSVHSESNTSQIDFNRAGTPLIEIVTEPVLESPAEVYAFLTEVRRLVRFLGICDGNMEEGSLRCDANVSVKRAGETRLGAKVEIKNMNSIRYAQQAVEVEITRQCAMLVKGEVIRSETRGFDASKGVTYSLRDKEELNDYRYFPEPDISPVMVSGEWLDRIRNSMPELPHEAMIRLTQVLGLSDYDARNLTAVPELLDYFDDTSKHTTSYKPLANWILGPVKVHWNETKTLPLTPTRLAELITLVEKGKLSFTAASQQVFPALVKAPDINALEMAQQLNVLRDENVEALRNTVEQVLTAMPDKVEAYRKGKKGLLSLFVGEIMKRSGGKADPKAIHEWVLTTLNKTEKE